MIVEDILSDLAYAQQYLSKKKSSIVAIKDGEIIGEKTGFGLRPFLELINEQGTMLSKTVLGDRILGKASALLCRYSQVRGVYSPQGTKSAIALLIMEGIPCQIDQMIPFIQNKTGDDQCPFEHLLEKVNDPTEAYQVLQEKIMTS